MLQDPKSMFRKAALDKLASPEQLDVLMEVTSPRNWALVYGMGGLTSVDWSGPVQPLVEQMANAVNYRTRVLGTSPAIPIIVTIYQKNAMLGDILRDVGYQCGRRASIAVYPESRVIELRYAKN